MDACEENNDVLTGTGQLNQLRFRVRLCKPQALFCCQMPSLAMMWM